MQALVVRGPNGTAVFTKTMTTRTAGFWKCSRDSFQALEPLTPVGMVDFLQSVGAHAITHTGAIQQIVELDT